MLNIERGGIKTEACHSAMILMTLEGQCALSVNGSGFALLEPGSITVIPEKGCYVITASEETNLLAYYINNVVNSWEDSFTEKCNSVKYNCDLRYPYILSMNNRLREYAQVMKNYLLDGVSDRRFMDMKCFELIHLLQFYYSGDVLFNLLHPLVNENGAFTRLVLDNWEAARNNDELAAFTGLSPSRFSVKFKEVFGVSPYKWITARRAERILYRLNYTDDSLRQIREDLHFGSAQHFNDFCKKQFGSSPGKIRSEKRKDPESDR